MKYFDDLHLSLEVAFKGHPINQWCWEISDKQKVINSGMCYHIECCIVEAQQIFIKLSIDKNDTTMDRKTDLERAMKKS